jgi:peptidyl-prolyl cis-trans isomerase SDCCAG10
MSTTYNVEPLPTARVIVHTTAGPLDIELWTKETPATCRSFLQLCLEGYYNNIIFHRVIKDFIVQTGDPTGTGTGGKAATATGVVKDEFHSRLRYIRRGLIGMANSGDKDDNGSQWFVTLGPTPELEKKNTMFGRLAVGDTIFNALKIGDLETDKYDRPLHPPRILRTEVLENPFTDIVPRSTAEERAEKQRRLEEEKAKAQVKKAKKQNKALLSFGDDEGEVTTTVKTKMKSVYDIEEEPKPVKQKQRKSIRKREQTPEHIDLTESATKSAPIPPPPVVEEMPPEEEPRPKAAKPTSSLEDQIASLKSELKGLKNKRPAEEEPKEAATTGKKIIENELSRYMSSGKAILGKRSRKGHREEETLARLAKFQRTIFGAKPVDEPAEKEEEEEEPCELHNVPGCMSCFDRMGEKPDEDDPKSLWGHKLVFAKDVFGKDGKFRQRRQEENLEVIDPRERAKEFAEEGKRGKKERSQIFRQEKRPR